MTRFEKPSIDLPLYRAALRRTLLASPRSEVSSSFMFIRLLPAGLALVLLFTVGFALRPQAVENAMTPPVSAEEIVADAQAALLSMSDEQIQALQQNLKGVDAETLLSEARAASDLRLLHPTVTHSAEGETTVTFEKSSDGVVSTLTWNTNPPQDLSFIEFTRPDGSDVIVGMDANDSYIPRDILSE